MVPLISIVIVSYNRAHFLPEALDSIRRQTFGNYEIILVDDGSTDNTKEITENYSGVRYIYQEHAGVSRARNTAVKAAKGKWIGMLDSDDLWQEEKLQKQIEYLRIHPDCRIVFCNYSNFTDIPEDKLDERQRETLKTVTKWCLPSALIDVGLFNEIGLFDETLEYGEDTDWVFRLKFLKVNTEHCVNEVLYFRRVHDSNISNVRKKLQSEDMQKLAVEAFRKVRKLRK